MEIYVLIEDTPGNPACHHGHGLSLYVKTQKHRLLMDTGADGRFVENAAVLGIDLTGVDTVILSHGHYDHAGGIMQFAQMNPDAGIYMQHNVGGEYYHGEKYIGIDKEILSLPQARLLDGDFRIDEELSLFTHITGRRSFPKSNLVLQEHSCGRAVQDGFSHEQCLVIRSEGKQVLLSGCAHNGILNILDRYRELYGSSPDLVVSGFHMMKKEAYTPEEIAVIEETAEELARMDTVFYSGHCTGQKAFDLMKPVMGDKLRPMHSGIRIV